MSRHHHHRDRGRDTEADDADAPPLPMSRLLALARPERPWLVWGLVSLGLGSAAGLIYPRMVQRLIDALSSGEASDLDRNVQLLFVVLAVQSVAVAARTWMFTLAGERIVARLRAQLYRRLLAQEVAFFDARRTGELVSRLGSDTTQIQSTVTTSVAYLLRDVVFSVGGLALMFVVSPWMAALMLGVVPPVALGAVWFGRRLGKLSKERSDAMADASSLAEEALGGLRTVRAFAREEHEATRYGVAAWRAYDVARRLAGRVAGFIGVMFFVSFAALGGVLWLGLHEVQGGAMTGGELTAFLLYGMTVAFSIAGMGEVWSEFSRARGAAARVFELLDREPDMPAPLPAETPDEQALLASGRAAAEAARSEVGGDGAADPDAASAATADDAVAATPGAATAPDAAAREADAPVVDAPARPRGRVHLSGVSFAYPRRPDVTVLRDVELDIPPGQTVAVVGPSGAGKSTLAALLLRFYDPSAGVITLDGSDLREHDPAWLRRQIGLVAQEPVLFATSVRENILYGRGDADEAALLAAARTAHADDFVRQLPDGYDTQVGERGVQLSGGQKQRVAIARALLEDPPVLVLDEATSALDAESEALVQEALDVLLEGRTCLVIAHRLSTVRDAHRVVVMDAGRIVQQGTHDELLAEDGLYRRLVQRQLVAG